MTLDNHKANNKRLTVLHFLPDNYVWGGIESYLAQLLPVLTAKDQFNIKAVVTQDSYLFKALQNAGVDVIGIPFPFKKPSLIRSAWVNPWLRSFDLFIYGHLIPILKKEKPDLVHIHSGRAEQLCIAKAGFPMVYTYHGYGGPYSIEASGSRLLEEIHRFFRPLFQWLVPALSGMLVVSQYEFERLYRERYLPCSFKAQVLHNGIPMQTLLDQAAEKDRDELRAELGVPPGARVIAFMCRLRADKNPDGFLRVAQRVIESSQRKQPVFFLVAGDGKKAALLADSFKPGGMLDGHGAYVGFRNDIPALVKASDITMSTALHEGFGLRILESMLFGRPSIAYSVGGIPEVYGFGNFPHLSTFEKGKDWLIPKGDEDQFVKKLTEMVNWSDETFEMLAPQLTAHALQFDLEPHIEQLQSFYTATFSRLGLLSKKSPLPASPSEGVVPRQLSSVSS